jgi:Tfp pilus assembly protein PilF
MDRIAKLKEFLQLNPTDSFVQHALALEYVKTGDEVNARLQFEALLEREPAYIGSYYHLGKLLERIGEKNGAIKMYDKGMEEAKKAGDEKNYRELRGVYEELSDK